MHLVDDFNYKISGGVYKLRPDFWKKQTAERVEHCPRVTAVGEALQLLLRSVSQQTKRRLGAGRSALAGSLGFQLTTYSQGFSF